MRSHYLSSVGQAPHHWSLTRQEKDQAFPQTAFIFCLSRNTEDGAAWIALGRLESV